MLRNADLVDALAFVTERIKAEALKSGEPLSDEQRSLLDDLPTTPMFSPPLGSNPECPPEMPVPRDFAYERLIALAREARRNDLALNPASDLEWKCVVAVSKLNRHPMSWLLQWAGMKPRSPWWDAPLLVGASLLLPFGALAVMFGLIETGIQPRWVVIGGGCIVMSLLLYFGSRHIENWQLKQEMEKCRRDRLFAEQPRY